MAVWQFQCNIIPVKENIDKLSYDEKISWKDISQPETELDLRTLSKHNLIEIVDYVKCIGACFLIGDKICPPELESIIPIMKQSEANKYRKNPVEYIESLNHAILKYYHGLDIIF